MLKSRVFSLSILAAIVGVLPVHHASVVDGAGAADRDDRRGAGRGERHDLLAEAVLLPSAQPGAEGDPRLRHPLQRAVHPRVVPRHRAGRGRVRRDTLIDALIRIAACESLLQPTMVGISDPNDVGLFQWNEKPPHYWWSSVRKAFDAWQDRQGAQRLAHVHRPPRHGGPQGPVQRGAGRGVGRARPPADAGRWRGGARACTTRRSGGSGRPVLPS